MRIEFLRPDWFWLLLLVPVWWLVAWRAARIDVVFPRTSNAIEVRPVGLGARIVDLLPSLLRALALSAVLLAVAGIGTVTTVDEEVRERLAVALVLDLSSSMQAEDMGELRSRLAIAQDRAARFAESRPGDRVALVTFGGEALVRVPLTNDPAVVAEAVAGLRLGLVSDGTDLSTAILTGTYVLRDDANEARVMVLLTDGAHNTEGLAPARAAATAADEGIRIYTISVGQPADPASADMDVQDEARMETILARAARLSGGRYFRATDAAALDSVYVEIDRLEEADPRVQARHVDTPREHWFFLVGLLALTLEWLLRGTRFGVLS